MRIDSTVVLGSHLKPLCSRDDHVMNYEPHGSRANTGNYDSYHCASGGCSVRYNSIDGYFTLMGMPGQTYSITEPGVNTEECPVHGGWLYRRENPRKEAGVQWSCGIQGCNFSYEAKTKGEWLRA
jgi:hypothetical protein